MNIFYSPFAVVGVSIELEEQESAHIAKVLRRQVGEEVFVFDGKGSLFQAKITAINKRNVLVQVEQVISKTPLSNSLHIAIAPTKNIERFEWFLEKATEIGIAEITPLICKHAERREIKIERLEKVLLGACKQSLKYTLPKLNEPILFPQFLAQQKLIIGLKAICYCEEKNQYLAQEYTGGSDLITMIGPEGDFTLEEVKLAVDNGFKTVSLGESRLRVETAGIVVSSLFSFLNHRV